MRKNKWLLTKTMIYFAFIAINLSCEKDLYDDAVYKPEKSTIKEVKFDELFKDSKFKSLLQSVSNNSNMARSAFENQNGFTISNTNVKVIQTDSVTSYTMLIQRDSVFNSSYFENLVIQEDIFNNQKAYLIKYTPRRIIPTNHNSFTLEGEITKSQIAFTGFNRNNSYQNTTQTDCYIEVLMCNESWTGNSVGTSHVATGYCKNINYLSVSRVKTICQDNGGGSSDTTIGDPFNGGGSSPGSDGDGLGDPFSGGGSSTGGSGTGSTGTNNEGFDSEVVTSPVAPEITLLTPCNKLNKLFNIPNPDIKSTIQNHLQTNIPINPNGEKAAYLQKLPNGSMGTTISNPTTTNSVGIRTGGNFYSAIHTHNITLYPMFSYSDVVVLNELNNKTQSHNQGMASFLLTCIDDNNTPQTYAIVFETNELNNNLNFFLNTPENIGCTQAEIAREIDKLLGEEFSKDSNYERVFLKFMAHTNVSLYKANSTLTSWNHLTPSSGFSNSIISTPCN